MASAWPDLATTNISFHAIPVAWVIALLSRVWARYLYWTAVNKDMDIAHPKNFTKTVSADCALDERTRGRILRAEAAMQNGLENIALFAAAVIGANAAGVDMKLVNVLSMVYCSSRIAYNYFYIHAETGKQALSRVVTFFIGIACCFHLFVKAGEKLNYGGL